MAVSWGSHRAALRELVQGVYFARKARSERAGLDMRCFLGATRFADMQVSSWQVAQVAAAVLALLCPRQQESVHTLLATLYVPWCRESCNEPLTWGWGSST